MLELEKSAGEYGPVAQLGERTVRIRKVVGSNPFRSTSEIIRNCCSFG